MAIFLVSYDIMIENQNENDLDYKTTLNNLKKALESLDSHNALNKIWFISYDKTQTDLAKHLMQFIRFGHDRLLVSKIEDKVFCHMPYLGSSNWFKDYIIP